MKFNQIDVNNRLFKQNTGIVSMASAQLPFYDTTWFRIVFLITIVIIVLLLYNYHVRKIKREKLEIQKRAEENIFAERNQLRTLIDNIPDFIYIKDRDSRFVVANKRVVDVLGATSRDNIIGKTDKDFYPPEYANKFYEDEKEIMRAGVPLISLVEPAMDETGKRIYLSTTKIPLKNSQGKIIGLVGIGRDITEFKETQRKLIEQADYLQEINTQMEERQEEVQQQSEELKMQSEVLRETNKELGLLNATKDKLFSIIAHDLKNPFHAISGFSDLLLKNFSKMTDEDKIELVELISISSESAFSLLENLLQWARTQTNKIKYKPEKIDLYEVVKQNIKFLRANARKKRIKLYTEVHENTNVYADRDMLNTIFRNLISNAIKFTAHEGEIRINFEENDDKVLISVTDNGKGIELDQQGKLFNLEEIYSTDGTAGETGTGLGLIVTKEFVSKNKGDIWVKSAPNEGSTFTFSLPRA